MVRRKMNRKRIHAKKRKIQVYLDEEDIEYLKAFMELLNIKSTSEAMRLIFKNFRMMFPHARYFVEIVLRIMKEEMEK